MQRSFYIALATAVASSGVVHPCLGLVIGPRSTLRCTSRRQQRQSTSRSVLLQLSPTRKDAAGKRPLQRGQLYLLQGQGHHRDSNNSNVKLLPLLLERDDQRHVQLLTLLRVTIPSIVAGVMASVLFPVAALFLASATVGVAGAGSAGALAVLASDSGQFVQNFQTVASLLFSILVGQTCEYFYLLRVPFLASGRVCVCVLTNKKLLPVF
jgi:hypothetical protein